MEKVRRS